MAKRKAAAPSAVPKPQIEPQLLQAARENARLRRDLASAERLRDEAIRQLHETEEQRRFMEIIDHDPINFRSISPKKITGESTAILTLSDWHWEERVDPSTVNYKNEFTPAIAAKRARGMFQKAAALIDFCRGFTTINQLVIAVLGDLITGYIHEELEESNWLSPTQAILDVQEHLVSGIEFLKKETKCKEIIIPTAVGNHGRTQRKKRISTSYKNSFEWLLYKMLAFSYRNDPIVRWQVGNGYHNWLEVQGHPVRFHHGDSIRYQGGVGGITIPVNKAIAAWNKTEPAALDIFGHYHQSKEDRWWVSNGSLIGMNAYTVEIKADYEEPSQSLTIMSRTRGKIANLRVFCE